MKYPILSCRFKKQKAFTLLQLVISVSVLVVSGVVVYKIVSFFRSSQWINSPGYGTNQLNQVVNQTTLAYTITYEPNAQEVGVVTQISGTLLPQAVLQTVVGTENENVQSLALINTNQPWQGFSFYYGLDYSSNPFVSLNYPTLATTQVTSTSSNNDTVTVDFSAPGDIDDSVTFNTTNATTPYHDNFQIALTGTNTGVSGKGYYGDSASDTNFSPPSTNTVIVQRKWMLTDPTWNNLYTDYVIPGAVSFYTDTQIAPQNPSPTNQTSQNGGTGGGGLIPPGGNGGNGQLGISSAFYRLAFSTNNLP